MDESLRQAIVIAYAALPDGCRHPPAAEKRLREFEQEFGPIPEHYRWFLATCGGGVCGAERVDGIEELFDTHRKFREESGSGGWTMRGVFLIGWDGAGNPFGIDASSGRVLVEDHNFGGVHEMAESFASFLRQGMHV